MNKNVPSKADIKLIHSLAKKKAREESALFVVEGKKMVAEALASGLEIEAVYYRDTIGEEMMSRISLLSSPSPALAVVRQPAPDKLKEEGITLVLDGVRDPGNLGTILRLAEWFGIENVVCSTDCVDVFNPKTVQSTMGTILRKVPLYTDIHEFITDQRAADIPVYVTALSGDNIYSSGINRLSRAVFVMGSENNGVSPQIMSLATGALFIPPFPATCNTGRSESLNVAIATSILCYELRRPR